MRALNFSSAYPAAYLLARPLSFLHISLPHFHSNEINTNNYIIPARMNYILFTVHCVASDQHVALSIADSGRNLHDISMVSGRMTPHFIYLIDWCVMFFIIIIIIVSNTNP